MIVNLDEKERELLVTELERSIIPDLREFIASGLRKTHRDELKKDEDTLKHLLEKLKLAA